MDIYTFQMTQNSLDSSSIIWWKDMVNIMKKGFLNLKDFGKMENLYNRKNKKNGLIILKNKILIGP